MSKGGDKRILPPGSEGDMETWAGLSNLTQAHEQAEDAHTMTSLRPNSFNEFVGQEGLKANLTVACNAARKRGESIDHILFHGPPGLGKTSLARIVAEELGVGFKSTSGPVIERPGDLAAILTSLEAHDVLFIDEIHRLSRVVEEVLYPAMEDYELDILIGQGPAARSVKIDLKPFTLIGATTRTGLLTSPLRDRFGIVLRLEYYAAEELCSIILRSAQLLSIHVEPDAALEIARRSRGTPRIANRLLKRVRDFADELASGVVTTAVTRDALHRLEVDERGLDTMDRRILRVIRDKFDGGPVGITSLAAAIGEERETLEEVYEPFLIQEGFLVRTPRGREVTNRGESHLEQAEASIAGQHAA